MRFSRILSIRIALLLTWLAAGPLRSQDCTPWLKTSDAGAGDLYGCAVSLSAGLLVVGSIGDDGRGTNAGKAYLYARTANGWQQRDPPLTPSDGAAGDQFGYAVALHDGLAVVGAPFKQTRGSASGAAYVFGCGAAGCTEETKLVPAGRLSPLDQFGLSVAVYRSTIAVGVPGAHAVDLFARGDGSWPWLQRIVPGEAAASFGFSVALRGGVLVVGAPFAGAVFVFVEQAGVWEPAGAPLRGSASDLFGYSVALGDGPGGWTAVVGAPGAPGGGAVHVFTSLTDDRRLTTPSPPSGDAQLGVSVAIDPPGRTVLAGARHDGGRGAKAGTAYVFTKQGGAFAETARLTDLLTGGELGAGDELGLGAAIADGVAVVGAFKDDDRGADAGAVYSFLLDAQDRPACQTGLTISIAPQDAVVCPGDALAPTVKVANADDAASASGAAVAVTFPEDALAGVTWTCKETGGAACGARTGRGNIDERVDVPPGGQLTYEVSARVRAAGPDEFTIPAEVSPSGLTGDASAAVAAVRVDCADLAVELLEDPGSAVAGANAGFLWRVTNRGPRTAREVRLEADARVFDLGELERGKNRDVRSVLAVPAGACCAGVDRLGVRAAVSGASKDPKSSNDGAEVAVPVTCQTDLAIGRLEATPEDACSGAPLSYLVAVTNAGVSDVCDAEVRAAVGSAAFSGIFCECTGTGGASCTSVGDLGGSFDLPAGETIVCRFDGTLDEASAPFAITAAVTPGGDSRTASFTADLADLTLAKLVTPAVATAGESVSYRLVVDNGGPCAAAGVVVDDPFLAAPDGRLSSCAPPCAGGFPCVLGGLPPGGRAQLGFSCVVDPTLYIGRFTGLPVANEATVSAAGPDPEPVNDTSGATFQAVHRADLELSVTDGLTTTYAGRPLVHTVTLRNTGPSALIDGVLTVDRPIPDEPPEVETIEALLPGDTFVKPIPGGVRLGELGELVLTVTIDDPQAGTLTAADRTVVLPPPDPDGAAVAAIMTVSGNFTVGGEVIYRLQVLNGGTADQGDNPGDELALALPPGLSPAFGSTASGGTLTIANGAFRWNGAVAGESFVELGLRARIVGSGPGEEVCAQGTVFYDGDGDGVNDKGDPTSLLEPGPERGTPTCFVVAGSYDVPAAGTVGWVVMAALLAAYGLAFLRRGLTPGRGKRPARE